MNNTFYRVIICVIIILKSWFCFSFIINILKFSVKLLFLCQCYISITLNIMQHLISVFTLKYFIFISALHFHNIKYPAAFNLYFYFKRLIFLVSFKNIFHSDFQIILILIELSEVKKRDIFSIRRCNMVQKSIFCFLFFLKSFQASSMIEELEQNVCQLKQQLQESELQRKQQLRVSLVFLHRRTMVKHSFLDLDVQLRVN